MGHIRYQSMDMLAACGRVEQTMEHINIIKNTSEHERARLIELKDKAAELLRDTNGLSGRAEIVRDLSVLRQEYVSGLKSLCESAKLDPRLDNAIKVALDIIDSEQPEELMANLNALFLEHNAIDSQLDIGKLGVPVLMRHPLPESARHVADDLPIGDLGIPVLLRPQNEQTVHV